MSRMRTWRDYAAVKKYDIIERYVERWNLTSFNNEMPAILSYFYVMGQTVVDYIRVPIWGSYLDPRVHVFWIQPTRTGKTIAWDFIGDLLDAAGVEKAMYSSGSDAGLIGTISKNSDGDLVTQHGILRGKKAMLFDEGGVLLSNDKKTYTVDTMNYLQGAMNPIGTDPNILTKPMANGVVSCQSSASLWITTFPVGGVKEVVLTKGLFQRVLLFVAHWETDDRRNVSYKRMGGVFRKMETDQTPIEDLAAHFIEIKQRCHDRTLELAELTDEEWNAKSAQEQQRVAKMLRYEMFTLESGAEWDVTLQSCIDEFYSLLDGLDPKMREIVCTFMPNTENYLILFATHLALTEGVWLMRAEHLELAIEIIYDIYERLVLWLETDIEVGQLRREKLAKMGAWKGAYDKVTTVDLGKHGDGWVQKSGLFARYMKQQEKSKPATYERFKAAKDWFDTYKMKTVVYVRWKGEN